MFEPAASPRVFALPLGVDFGALLIKGIRERLHHQPPEAIARVQLIVNTRRAQRRLREIFDAGPPTLLPRIGLITDIGESWAIPGLPEPVPRLRRRLELLRLVSALIERQPELAPRSAAYDLANSLADLMDEMHSEGVSPDVIASLDISEQSEHWERIRAFLTILRPYFDLALAEPDIASRQRLAISRLTEHWRDRPPAHPIIIAGSTGSRGATQMLMRAVAQLPQGAVVLPGFDFDMPGESWAALGNQMLSEDHPQYRFHALLSALDMTPSDVRLWQDTSPQNPSRNRLLSLALRPAPVTDQWLIEGPDLAEDLAPATESITLLEAPDPRSEALCIAMALREATEHGRRAALITPDRTLTRQVAAALDRWNIRPDDSAGTPLHLSAPGRFLRHVAELFAAPLSSESLLTLLKHPLTHRGAERGQHLLFTRELELYLRRSTSPFPNAIDIRAWALTSKNPMAVSWSEWLIRHFCEQTCEEPRELSDWLSNHLALAEHIATGPLSDTEHTLWSGDAGMAAQKVYSSLIEHATVAGELSVSDFTSLLHSVLSAEEVRNAVTAHPDILIWGTLEARIQRADLTIIAGLNEGSWPETSQPDPWLNRALRQQAGLLLPERKIGLAAHDFQQAAASGEIWLTRSKRSEDSETVPARWLNRLLNLLRGLSAQGGPAVVEAMQSRGQHWLDRATQLEEPGTMPRAQRPAPCPPVTARPQTLAVTDIRRLIRDPYSIYAKHVLRLRPLDPLMREPDALVRGIVLHEVMEEFIRATRDKPEDLSVALLMEIARRVTLEHVPWASARALWLARIDRIAESFVEDERLRRKKGSPAALEAKGKLVLTDPPFTLSATADRIDLDASGNIILYDYKTGTPPTNKQQLYYDKQLLLEAVIAEQAGFGELIPNRVLAAHYLGLGTGAPVVDAPLEDEPVDKVLSGFRALISAYNDPETGYVSRRAVHERKEKGDYDHLARFGEWDITDTPTRIALT